MKKIFFGSLAFIVVTVLVTSVALAKNDNSQSKGNDVSKSKSEKVKNLKDYEKPTNGKTNSIIHKEKTDKVSAELLEVAEVEKNKGQKVKEKNEDKIRNEINNPDTGEQDRERNEELTEEEIAQELEEVVAEADETQDETVEAIEKVEKQNGFKKFLIGTDYKNLGQLRSSLAHNENQVRKLIQLSGSLSDEESRLKTEEQMTTLMQERERIKSVISANEDGFSLLGWVFRFMNGYSSGDVINEEEAELEDEVTEVLEDDENEDSDEIEETEEIVEDEETGLIEESQVETVK